MQTHRNHNGWSANARWTGGVCGVLALAVAGLLRAEIISDFNDGVPDWDIQFAGDVALEESDGMLTMNMDGNAWASFLWNKPVAVVEGVDLVLSLDLIDTQANGSAAVLVFGWDMNPDPNVAEGYYFAKHAGGIGLLKFRSVGKNDQVAVLIWENIGNRHSNITCSLTVRREGESLDFTIKVEERQPGVNGTRRVFYERSITDTPARDACYGSGWKPYACESGQVQDAPFLGDAEPWLGLGPTFGMTFPAVVRVDDFRFEHHSAMDIVKAVRLSWDAAVGERVVEGAIDPAGPWSEVTGRRFEESGVVEFWVDASVYPTMQFFRTRSPNAP